MKIRINGKAYKWHPVYAVYNLITLTITITIGCTGLKLAKAVGGGAGWVVAVDALLIAVLTACMCISIKERRK